MSRQSDGWEDNPAGYLWGSWLERATRSKRGQAALREFIAALDAMPVRALGCDNLVSEDGMACSLGVIHLYRRTKTELNPLRRWLKYQRELAELRDEYQDYDGDITNSAQFGKEDLGLAWTMAWDMAEENDIRGYAEKPEHRWARMRAWAERQLLKEVA